MALVAFVMANMERETTHLAYSACEAVEMVHMGTEATHMAFSACEVLVMGHTRPTDLHSLLHRGSNVLMLDESVARLLSLGYQSSGGRCTRVLCCVTTVPSCRQHLLASDRFACALSCSKGAAIALCCSGAELRAAAASGERPRSCKPWTKWTSARIVCDVALWARESTWPSTCLGWTARVDVVVIT